MRLRDSLKDRLSSNSGDYYRDCSVSQIAEKESMHVTEMELRVVQYSLASELSCIRYIQKS